MTLADFSIGDIVIFGRRQGEKTRGKVVRKGRSKLKVEQLESRGHRCVRPVGTVWTVPPSMCLKVTGNTPPSPQPRAGKPPARGSDSKTFTRVAETHGFDISLLGQRINLNGKRLTIVGCCPRAPKYPFLGEGIRGGRYKLTVQQIRSSL